MTLMNNIGDYYFLDRKPELTDSLDTLDTGTDLYTRGDNATCQPPARNVALPAVFLDSDMVYSDSTTEEYTFNSQWVIETNWWCNRLTVYLVRAMAVDVATQASGVPDPIQIQFRTGLPYCADPYKVSQVIVAAPSFNDGGLILDVALPPFKCIECWATVPNASGVKPTTYIGCKMLLRVLARNYGTTPPATAEYGYFTTQAAKPTAGVILT